MGGVDRDCADRAGERGGLARGIDPVAFDDGVVLALVGAAAGAFGGIGVEEETEIGVGENHGADVAALHDEAAEAVGAGDVGLAALVARSAARSSGIAAKWETAALTADVRISASATGWPEISIWAERPFKAVPSRRAAKAVCTVARSVGAAPARSQPAVRAR